MEGAKILCNTDNPIAFIGAMTISNVKVLLVDEDLQDELNQLQINACINVLNTLDDTLLELTKEVCGNARYLIASKNINVKTSH